MNSALSTTLIAAGAALIVGLIGLVGVPISAQVTGAVQRGTERRKQQAAQESNALGALLRAWVVMNQAPAGTVGEAAPTYDAAYCDWLSALGEMAAYGGSTAAKFLALFVGQGSDASTRHGQDLFIQAVLAVRQSALPHRMVGRSDGEWIRILLFGPDTSPTSTTQKPDVTVSDRTFGSTPSVSEA
jgi:hypothetical protein